MQRIYTWYILYKDIYINTHVHCIINQKSAKSNLCKLIENPNSAKIVPVYTNYNLFTIYKSFNHLAIITYLATY